MKTLAPLCLLAGCATLAPVPPPPPRYVATSHDPFWVVTVGSDRITLTRGPEGGRADGELTSTDYPGAVTETINGARSWQTGQGTMVISVQTRPGPCTTGGRTYPDRVVVKLSGVMLQGCGGAERAAS